MPLCFVFLVKLKLLLYSHFMPKSRLLHSLRYHDASPKILGICQFYFQRNYCHRRPYFKDGGTEN